MQDWPQNTLPVISTMNIPIVKEGLLQITKLVQGEQRLVAFLIVDPVDTLQGRIVDSTSAKYIASCIP